MQISEGRQFQAERTARSTSQRSNGLSGSRKEWTRGGWQEMSSQKGTGARSRKVSWAIVKILDIIL